MRGVKKILCKKAFTVIMASATICTYAAGCTVTKDSVQSAVSSDVLQSGHSENAATMPPDNPSDIPALTVDDCVKDAYEIICTRGEDEYLLEIEYHVPEITLDCEGARMLNDRILSDCEEAKLVETNPEDYPMWNEISYDAYLNGEYLSVVVQKKTAYGNYKEYAAYNLNVASGEVVSAQELAESTGIKESDITGLLRKTAVYEADRITQECISEPSFLNNDDTEYLQEVFLENLNARFHTIEESNLKLEQIPMFLSENGELQAVIPIHTLAGAGISHTPLKLKFQTSNKDFTTSFDNAVFISYTDGNISVRIEENEWTNNAFYNGCIEFGKEYPVAGVYKDYIQGEMLGLMNGDYVIPVFVSDDHTVAYLDIYECAQAGSFCLTEMAYVPYAVEAITDENADTLAEDLSRYIFGRYDWFSQNALNLSVQEGCGLESALTTEDGAQIMLYQYMEFDVNDPGILYFQESDSSGSSIKYEGRCTYVGMDEKGIILSYHLQNTEYGLERRGMFGACRAFILDEETDDLRVCMKYRGLGGDELFLCEQEFAELSFSFG